MTTRPSPTESADAAAEAGLRYVNADDSGFGRRRRGRGFSYHNTVGRLVSDTATLARIRSLAIPPAWREVWICPHSNGHIQATGRDARGRKQYRYHQRWRVVRDTAKFDRTLEFGRALPRLRRRVARDLRRRGLPRQKVLATLVRLLEMSLIRVGNEEYARDNGSYGLTTLRQRHARVTGDRLCLSFRGKAGRRHEVDISDRRLARVLRQCQELPGQRLFQYMDDDGQTQSVDSDDVNDYLRSAMGADFSARDFRTWAGTLLATLALSSAESADDQPVATSLTAAVGRVARQLGNTPAVCRRAYIHPAVIELFQEGGLPAGAAVVPMDSRAMATTHGLVERQVLALLQARRQRTLSGTGNAPRAA